MSLFTAVKLETKPKEIPEGKYLGRIQSAEPKKTKQGHQIVEMKIRLDGQSLHHYFSVNLEHPNAREIAQKTLTQIFTYGYKNPPVKLDTVSDIAMALVGAPVHVTIKKKGVNDAGYTLYGTYFNELPETARVEFAERSESEPQW